MRLRYALAALALSGGGLVASLDPKKSASLEDVFIPKGKLFAKTRLRDFAWQNSNPKQSKGPSGSVARLQGPVLFYIQALM